MSGVEDEKVRKLLELVEKRVEQCLLRYMNKEEAIEDLSVRDNIEPYFTNLVWLRLEKQNEEFFKVYNLSLLVKNQITEFNRLLSQQVMLMHRSGLTGISPAVISNGYHVSPTQQMSTSFAAQSNRFPGDMFNNYGSSMLSGETGKVDMSVNGRNIDISPSMLSHNPNSGFGRTMNGNIVKAEPSYYAGSSPFNFSQPSSFPESRQQMGDACLANFSNIEPNSQHLLETLLDGDTSSYGFLEPIPPNFDFPGDNFTNLPESNSGQSYIAPDANNSLDSHGPVQRFDPASERSGRQQIGRD